MRNITYLLLIAFSYCLYDIHHFRKRGLVRTNYSEQNQTTDLRRVVRKKIEKRYSNKKFKEKRIYAQKKLKYSISKPLGKRFSNQRMLRRMYRNT